MFSPKAAFEAFSQNINKTQFHFRYRQLYNLHAQIKKELSSGAQPGALGLQPIQFPPKKFLSGRVLTGIQLEERRQGLERWLQLVSQPGTPTAACHALQGFMLAAQLETWAGGDGDSVDLDVFLMNDQKYTVRGRPSLQTEDVLEVRGHYSYLVNFAYHRVYQFNLAGSLL